MIRLIEFLLVGVANTLVVITSIYDALFIFQMNFVASNAPGYGVGIIVAFALNGSWTFRHSGSQKISLARWLAVAAIAYLCNLLLAMFALRCLNANPYVAQGIGVIGYTTISFLGAWFHVFSTPSERGLRL
jgi:putative flippase GtrA